MKLEDYINKYHNGWPNLTDAEARAAGLTPPLSCGWFACYREKNVDGNAMRAALKVSRKHVAKGRRTGQARQEKGPRALFSKHEPAHIPVTATVGAEDKYAYINSPEFLQSFEWRQVRFQALQKYGRRCQCCGASPETGTVINVDHVKSRRRFPALALDIDNLQVLCVDCNHGKANSTVDFRAQ
jgi:hypothetical protein